MPATPDDLLDRLAALEIATTTVDHPPAFTVEDGEAYVGHLPGVHVKNLFLCDAKKKMWLVTVPWDQTIDLKGLPTLIKCIADFWMLKWLLTDVDDSVIDDYE